MILRTILQAKKARLKSIVRRGFLLSARSTPECLVYTILNLGAMMKIICNSLSLRDHVQQELCSFQMQKSVEGKKTEDLAINKLSRVSASNSYIENTFKRVLKSS